MTRFVRTTSATATGILRPVIVDTATGEMAIFVSEAGADHALLNLTTPREPDMYRWQEAVRITP